MLRRLPWLMIVTTVSCFFAAGDGFAIEKGLIGYWPLEKDSRDHSGNGHDGANHNANLQTGEFNGRDSYIEIPNAPAFQLGKGDFTVTAEISTKAPLEDSFGDILTKFDSKTRRGVNFTLCSNTSGYNSQSDSRDLFFGLDSGTEPKWEDCGRPSKSHNSDALTVFKGELYAGTTDGEQESEWAHVFKYRGDQKWEDCGRVGDRRTRGVYAMIVHGGALYAATAGPHGGPHVNKDDFCRVYMYRGGQKWDDIGQPGDHFRINSLASFRGKLYALSIHSGGNNGGVYEYQGGQAWKQIGDFGRPHASGIHNGRLYAAYPRGEAFTYDGHAWEELGNPYGSLELCNQIHSVGIYQGEPYFGTWRNGSVALRRNNKWLDMGHLADATEVVGLIVYNGSFYAGTIPRAEVVRFDGPKQWTSLRRLFDPPDYNAKHDTEDWSRASSLTVFQGKTFVSTATCYRAMLTKPRPNEIRGRVYNFSTGAAVSLDHDLGPESHPVAAVRNGNSLRLYVDGKLAAERKVEARELDISNDAPLLIGFGPQSYFCGKIQNVRLYNRALEDDELQQLQQTNRSGVNDIN